MAELSRPIDKEFNVEVEGGRFSTEFLNDLVDTHVNKIAPRYVKFQKLYEGKHKIQNRPRKDKNKPNNKLVNDFFGQTIDNTVGYFLGNPIVLNYTEPKKDKAPVEADPADVGVDLTELEDTAIQDEFLIRPFIHKLTKVLYKIIPALDSKALHYTSSSLRSDTMS